MQDSPSATSETTQLVGQSATKINNNHTSITIQLSGSEQEGKEEEVESLGQTTL